MICKQVEKLETSLLETTSIKNCSDSTCKNENSGTNVEHKDELEMFKEESIDELNQENDLVLKNLADTELDYGRNQKFVHVLKQYFGYNSFRPYVYYLN